MGGGKGGKSTEGSSSFMIGVTGGEGGVVLEFSTLFNLSNI